MRPQELLIHALTAVNTLATALIDRLMLYGEAMVIQGSSFRTKGETPDE